MTPADTPNGDPQDEPKPTPPVPTQGDPGDEDAPLGERHPDKAPPEEPVTQPSEARAVALARIDRLH